MQPKWETQQKNVNLGSLGISGKRVVETNLPFPSSFGTTLPNDVSCTWKCVGVLLLKINVQREGERERDWERLRHTLTDGSTDKWINCII